MHVPNPLGGVPLILRPSSVVNPLNGELLMDYENNDLLYVNKETGKISSIAENIYKSIILANLANSTIKICKESGSSGEEEELPDVSERDMNTWYFTITARI